MLVAFLISSMHDVHVLLQCMHLALIAAQHEAGVCRSFTSGENAGVSRGLVAADRLRKLHVGAACIQQK